MGVDPVCDVVTDFINDRGELNAYNLLSLITILPKGTTDAELSRALNTLVRVGHIELRVIELNQSLCLVKTNS